MQVWAVSWVSSACVLLLLLGMAARHTGRLSSRRTQEQETHLINARLSQVIAESCSPLAPDHPRPCSPKDSRDLEWLICEQSLGRFVNTLACLLAAAESQMMVLFNSISKNRVRGHAVHDKARKPGRSSSQPGGLWGHLEVLPGV